MESSYQSGAFQAEAGATGFRTARLSPGLIRDRLTWQKVLPLSLAPAISGRLVVLFFTLSAIKLALILALNRNLYEVHWRFAWPAVTGLNLVAFNAFVFIGVLSILSLARSCQSVHVKSIRALNGAILTAGFLFVFFGFHTGDKNYLFPIMSGILRWTSLGPYLSLDLFFRPPFLGGWVFCYAMVYYVLARTGREGWVLHWTAVCAGAYALTSLRELFVYRDELLLVDALGLVCLLTHSLFKAKISLRRSAEVQSHSLQGGSVTFAWWFIPISWTCFFAWQIFHLTSGLPRLSILYFSILLLLGVLLFSGASLVAYKHRVLGDWSCFILFYFTGWLLLSNTHYPVAENFRHVLFLAITFPRYLAGEATVVGAVGLTAMLWRWWRPNGSLLWLDCINLLLIAVAFVDFRLTQIMGVRLDWHLISLGTSAEMGYRIVRPFLDGAAVAATLLVCIYVVFLRLLLRRQMPQRSRNPGGFGLWCLVASFVCTAVVGLLFADADKAEGQASVRLVQASPIWQRVFEKTLDRDHFLKAADSLRLGDFDPQVRIDQRRTSPDLNVVLIFLESSYNRHLSLFGAKVETQPQLKRYQERMEVFPNFFSNFAGSIQARFAAFTSLYPVRDYNAFTLEHIGVKDIFSILHEQGYDCSMFYSSFFDYTGFREFLRGRGLDEMYDAENMPGPRTSAPVSWGLREEETLRAMRNRIKAYAASGRRFFLTYVPAAPHHPYDSIPPEFLKFPLGAMNDFTPLYLNELLYIDFVMASILQELQDSGELDKTLVLITNDHGEMLGENGGHIGHGWAITPELVNTPLIILDPRRPGFRINHAFGSQVDILPTLLQRLGISAPSNQLYQGRSLDASPVPARVEYLNSFQQFAVLIGDQLVLGDREGAGLLKTPVVFSVTDEGTKTVFARKEHANVSAVSIHEFDRFQENFLKHYSYYCGMMRAPKLTRSGVLR